MKNKKAIIIISAAFLALVLLASLTVNFHIRLIMRRARAETAKQYQLVPVSDKVDKIEMQTYYDNFYKDSSQLSNYSLTCKLINADIRTIGYWEKGYQPLMSKFVKDYGEEFEIKVENEKAVIWNEDYQIVRNIAASLTLYRYDRPSNSTMTISIDRYTGNGFFNQIESFLLEESMTSAVISCREK